MKDIKRIFPDQKIIAIVGVSGSGKTSMARKLADELNGQAHFMDSYIFQYIIALYNESPKSVAELFEVSSVPDLNDPEVFFDFYVKYLSRRSFAKAVEDSGELAEKSISKEILRMQVENSRKQSFDSGWSDSGNVYSCNTKKNILILEGINLTRAMLESADLIIRVSVFPSSISINAFVERVIKLTDDTTANRKILVDMLDFAYPYLEEKFFDDLCGLKVLQVPNNRDRSINDISAEIVKYFHATCVN